MGQRASRPYTLRMLTTLILFLLDLVCCAVTSLIISTAPHSEGDIDLAALGLQVSTWFFFFPWGLVYELCLSNIKVLSKLATIIFFESVTKCIVFYWSWMCHP